MRVVPLGGVGAEEMHCREGCGRFQVKEEASHGRSFTPNLEDRIVNLGCDFGGAAVEIGQGFHGVFNDECIGKKKESGIGTRP